MTLNPVPLASDKSLVEVRTALTRMPNLSERLGKAFRNVFDEVIDGPRTGRYRLEQLDKTEKTYIGTKVEIVLRQELGLERGKLLDNLIAGYEVDTKFSLPGDWMIPKEAVGQLCLLVQANDNAGIFSIGLLRASDDALRPGRNRDQKRGVSAAGKAQISWLLRDVAMPPNFMLGLDDSVRQRILAPARGTERVRELFRSVTGILIPRHAIEQVAQQRDPLKRARQMKAELAKEGLQVLCAKYDRAEFVKHGFADARNDDWLCIKL